MSTGGGKITDALLAQLTEKRELYTKLATEYESQLQFAESLEREISLSEQKGLNSSGSSARISRGLSSGRNIEEEAQLAREKTQTLSDKLTEVQNDIEALEDLLK